MLIDDRQLAAIRGLSNADLQRMAASGELPQPIRQGRRWYWNMNTLARHFSPGSHRRATLPQTAEVR